MTELIRLVEMFWTFQGEGANWGRRALFVRMPFCNLKCTWCDTEFNKFEKFTEQQIIDFASQEPCRFAVITGGEPMMNKDTPRVIKILKDLGFEIACETNGTFPIYDGIDFVTVSPKRDAGYSVHPSVIEKINELKIVVDHGFDFKVCTDFEFIGLSSTCRKTLSPEYGFFKLNVDQITRFIQENPKWRISLQTHKWLGVR